MHEKCISIKCCLWKIENAHVNYNLHNVLPVQIVIYHNEYINQGRLKVESALQCCIFFFIFEEHKYWMKCRYRKVSNKLSCRIIQIFWKDTFLTHRQFYLLAVAHNLKLPSRPQCYFCQSCYSLNQVPALFKLFCLVYVSGISLWILCEYLNRRFTWEKKKSHQRDLVS